MYSFYSDYVLANGLIKSESECAEIADFIDQNKTNIAPANF